MFVNVLCASGLECEYDLLEPHFSTCSYTLHLIDLVRDCTIDSGVRLV